MNVDEMKRITALLFQSTNEKDSSLIEKYLAEKIKWHDGCDGNNGSDVIFEWPKRDFINANILGIGGFKKQKQLIYRLLKETKCLHYLQLKVYMIQEKFGIILLQVKRYDTMRNILQDLKMV